MPQQLNKVVSQDGGELRRWLPRLIINLRTHGVTSYSWQPRLTGDRFDRKNNLTMFMLSEPETQ